MFKTVIAVAAIAIIAGQANAQASRAAKGAAEAGNEIGSALKGGKTLKPGQAGGAKVTGSGVTSEKVGAAGVTSSGAAASAKVDAGLSCRANGPISQLSREEQAVIQSAVGAGIGGSACLEKFETVDTVRVAVSGLREGVAKANQLGITDVKVAGKGKVKEVAMSFAAGLGKGLGADDKTGRQKASALCNNGCDVTSAAVCEVMTN